MFAANNLNMKLVVVCDESQKEEFLVTALSPGVDVLFTGSLSDVPGDTGALFDLLFDGTHKRVDILKSFLPLPVFVNAVIPTLADIQQPFIRINAWPGFLRRGITEMVALPLQEDDVKKIFNLLSRKYELVPDWPGMVSPRVIAAIVNEAYFTFGDGVSTRDEIDLAMKWGTNYPYGPFEWGERIGIGRIHTLLTTLSLHDKRYQPAPLLADEAGMAEIKKN
jgi:3-hydroxybutyryl-CoA dehydrogenase